MYVNTISVINNNSDDVKFNDYKSFEEFSLRLFDKKVNIVHLEFDKSGYKFIISIMFRDRVFIMDQPSTLFVNEGLLIGAWENILITFGGVI